MRLEGLKRIIKEDKMREDKFQVKRREGNESEK